jgi:hypothetical protein
VSAVWVNRNAIAVLGQRLTEAASRCDLPTPGGPKASRLASLSSQERAGAGAVSGSLLVIGTDAKSKVAKLLLAGKWALQVVLDAPLTALGKPMLKQGCEITGDRQGLAVGRTLIGLGVIWTRRRP